MFVEVLLSLFNPITSYCRKFQVRACNLRGMCFFRTSQIFFLYSDFTFSRQWFCLVCCCWYYLMFCPMPCCSVIARATFLSYRTSQQQHSIISIILLATFYTPIRIFQMRQTLLRFTVPSFPTTLTSMTTTVEKTSFACRARAALENHLRIHTPAETISWSTILNSPLFCLTQFLWKLPEVEPLTKLSFSAFAEKDNIKTEKSRSEWMAAPQSPIAFLVGRCFILPFLKRQKYKKGSHKMPSYRLRKLK